MRLGLLPSLGSGALERSIGVSTSIRAAAQAMRRAVRRGQSETVRELLSAGSVPRIDAFAYQEIEAAISALPTRPTIAPLRAPSPLDELVSADRRADFARALIEFGFLDAAGARAFCSGSLKPLTALADEALESFRREIERLSAQVPDLSTFQTAGSSMFMLGIVGGGDCKVTLTAPLGEYHAIGQPWFWGEGSTDRAAFSALLSVGDLVTPLPYLSPLDVLRESGVATAYGPVDEILDALREGVGHYGLEAFLDMADQGTVPDELEAAAWLCPAALSELAQIEFRTTDFAAWLVEEVNTNQHTLEHAFRAVSQAPDRLQKRLSVILSLLETVNELAPDPGEGWFAYGPEGGACLLPIYEALTEFFIDTMVHQPLMEDADDVYVGVNKDLSACLRYHALRMELYAVFCHLFCRPE